MSSKVHYEDNLFFLHSILRTIESGLRLDIDSEYFKDKVLEDIFFIDSSLMRTFSTLKDNAYLINRSAYLRSLRRTVRAFVDFLIPVTSGRLGAPDIVDAYQDRLRSTLSAHQKVIHEIDTILDHLEPDDEATDVMSLEEYDFLLSPTDSSDDESEK
ncbi:MAG: hypothetical protein WCY01_10350 [Alkalispirochaeta sp.]|jgi:hypothetical protein